MHVLLLSPANARIIPSYAASSETRLVGLDALIKAKREKARAEQLEEKKKNKRDPEEEGQAWDDDHSYSDLFLVRMGTRACLPLARHRSIAISVISLRVFPVEILDGHAVLGR